MPEIQNVKAARSREEPESQQRASVNHDELSAPDFDLAALRREQRDLRFAAEEKGEAIEGPSPETATALSKILSEFNLPSAKDIIRLPLDMLEGQYEEAREIIKSATESLAGLIPRLGMSGVSKENLEKILDERTGFHDGLIQIWKISERFGGALLGDRLDLNPEQLTSALEEAAFRAIDYADPKWKFRKAFGAEPGGIVIVLPPHPSAGDTRSEHTLRPDLEKTFPNPIVEDSVSFDPRDFSEIVLGVINHESVADYRNVGRKLEKALGKIIDEERSDLSPERREQLNEHYKSIQPRIGLIDRCTSLQIVREALEKLALRNDKIARGEKSLPGYSIT